jgi:flagellar biosynthesis/type III secretory pathway M-ring protein FliF/YscJ
MFNESEQAGADLIKGQKTKDLIIYILLGVTLLVILFATFRLIKNPQRVQGPILAPDSTEAAMQAVSAATAEDGIPDIPVDADRHTYKEQINKFYNKSPDTVVHLIRNWLNEE